MTSEELTAAGLSPNKEEVHDFGEEDCEGRSSNNGGNDDGAEANSDRDDSSP
jgi:Uri superfamily endonuclease